jgi:ABC-type nitrate/sulfonate/bicarbonate transport system substrate-binding protein
MQFTMQCLRRPVVLVAGTTARRRTAAAAAAFFSTASPNMKEKLRIGFVPEHFSTPLHFASTRYNLDADLVPYPSGTGHMVQSLKSKEIDVGIGLTEGWVAGLGKETSKAEFPYRIVGTYVETPLCWAISSGAQRNDITSFKDLRGTKNGVSRIGSGSYVMGFVLADQNGWLSSEGAESKSPFEIVVLNDFKRLRDGVNSGEADFFMWEHFTSKRYYDNGEIKRVGEIYTPWSSWKIVARQPDDQRLGPMFEAINKGVAHFNKNKEEAVEYISTHLDYSKEDATAWLETVRFPEDVKGVDGKVIRSTIDILGKAGVLDANKAKVSDMVAFSR